MFKAELQIPHSRGQLYWIANSMMLKAELQPRTL